MDIKKISPFLSVSPQIYAAHIERLAVLGFKTLINNRPDHETDDQPLYEELKAEAGKHGMQLLNIPVIPGQLTDQNVKDFWGGNTACPGAGAGLLPLRNAFDQFYGRCMKPGIWIQLSLSILRHRSATT